MFGNGNCTLKYYKRLKVYKNSTGNVFFDPSEIYATSYNWWVFVKVIDGLVVFNDYNYSMSTSVHQSAVRAQMRELGIKIDLIVQTETSLSNFDSIKSFKSELIDQYTEKLKQEIAATRSSKSSLPWGHKQTLKNIEALENLGLKLSQKELKELRDEVLAEELMRLFKLKLRRDERPELFKNKQKAIQDDCKAKLKDLSPIDFKNDEIDSLKAI